MRGLDEEREYAERCRVALQAMITGARENVVVGELTWGDRYTAERLGYYLKSLAQELGDEGTGPPFFGLIGYGTDETAGEHSNQTYYLGRRHISDAIGRPPLVIDWRAPVSTSFYRASPTDPRGITTRRRFGWSTETLTGYEDEHLTHPPHPAATEGGVGAPSADGGVGSNGGVGTPGADHRVGTEGGVGGGLVGILRAEIERPRVGPMRDIVATIQPEQDLLVRAELDESLCVQGAPGTGKTAVGLHRAAHLLYVHRARLQRNGVLVLGPNRAFLHYISAVLPTLGEVDVEQTTIEELLTGEQHPIRSTDEPAAARVKHDARMAEVLRRALYDRIRPPADAVVVPDSSYRWRVNQCGFEQMVDDAQQEATAYLLGRERVISRLVAALQRQAEARGQNCNGNWLRKMGRAVSPAVDAVWPAVKVDELLAELLSDRTALAAAADQLLTEDEQAAISWKRARPHHKPRAKSALWTAADAVLLDEASALLERGQTYGHVIIDEAQDLSPMQCRAIARRSEHGSITVLGDLAQGTTPWAARDWPEQLGHLGKPDSQVIALTTGYRVPAAVVELANRLLDGLGVDVPPTRSFRSDGRLTVQRTADLARACTDAVRAALKEEGSIGVIAADDATDDLRRALHLDGIDTIEADGDGRVAVVPATIAKGLEYDHVIVIEPAAIVEAESRGLNRLYVVLTRAVSRLEVLHSRDLPPELDRTGT
ncbi:AAA family ATPase [Streptomyces sp. SID13031]|uniref:HelD family protein n=1 Tax=Streptomyces sp. SID13031 TaxID=2706046 RepID=UPI0013CB8FF0|nr:AAA family ATPase [Streptomyces sp. SID13031]NEA30373.1 AAA family ATPase [Streptomyces sp. SID13031]